jgi:hypothetical protein
MHSSETVNGTLREGDNTNNFLSDEAENGDDTVTHGLVCAIQLLTPFVLQAYSQHCAIPFICPYTFNNSRMTEWISMKFDV